MRIGFLLLLAFFTVRLALAGDAQITRQLLLEGCPVPEKREFPLGAPELACENFSTYVCGKTESSFQLPADRSYWSFAFSDAAERLLYAKKRYFSLLQNGYAPRTPRAAQLKDLYLGCMNLKARKSEELANLKKKKAEIEGLKTREDLTQFLASHAVTPGFSFLGYDDIGNQKDPSDLDLLIVGAGLTFPDKSYYEDDAGVASLQSLATEFFKVVGADQPEQRALWLVEFEKAWGKASPSQAEMYERRAQNTYRDRDSLLKLYPNLGLEKVFARLNSTTPVRDYQPEGLAFFSEALAKEPLEKLKSVVLFHSFHSFHSRLGYSELELTFPEYFQKFFEFRARLGGAKKLAPLEERCTKRIMDHEIYAMELDQELVPILFPNFPVKKARAMVERVRQSILEGLRKNEWLSEGARAEAIKKIGAAKLSLVYPEKEKDWGFLPISKYSPKAYLANLNKFSEIKTKQLFERLRKKRNMDQWSMPPLMVNAGYMPEGNSFVMPIAVLQPPLFDPAGTDAQNLGGVGVIVGHELGHAVDNSGAQFDSEGKLRNWMTEKDREHFADRSKAFVDLFESYGHNGKFTLGENIGDHVGLTFAFQAAFPQGVGNPESVKEFYLSFGRSWCSVVRPEFEKMLLKSDPHALGWARINGQSMQQDSFQNAYSCKPGDKMFQEKPKRIRVW